VLVITEATTKTHVSRVLAKLGLHSRVQAAIAAQDAGRVSERLSLKRLKRYV
jgi:DNA-binding NarL/FixJ family response regulator